jgi:hypothetical protein
MKKQIRNYWIMQKIKQPIMWYSKNRYAVAYMASTAYWIKNKECLLMMNDKTIYRKHFGNFRRCAGFNLTKEPVRRRSEPAAYIHLNLLSTAYGDYCSSRRQKLAVFFICWIFSEGQFPLLLPSVRGSVRNDFTPPWTKQ